ncbi:MAG: monovalent cation:proton antiporter-2 (CPA2) family protein [Pseudomonadota bacterium]
MTDYLFLSFVFLVAGVISVPLATRFGLGSVLGYLIAGILISPILAAFGVDVVAIQHFAEFGVVMMLFLVGLELEPKRLWEMRARLLGLGGLQVVLTALAAMAVAMLLAQPWSVALAIGLVLSLSSTAIVLQTLGEKGLLQSDGGQSSFAVLLFQDIAVIPMLALIPLLALPELAELATGGDHSGGDHGDDHGTELSLVAGLAGWQTALVTLGAIAAVIGIGTLLARPLFDFVSTARLRELFTATALLLVIGIALLMSLVGLSPALGTFLAGVVLANSEYRHELEADIDPFRGLLLGLFFMTVGAGIDFALLREGLLPIVGLTLLLIAIKAGVLYVLGFLFGLRGAALWLCTLSLAQAGEFGFVLLSFTVANAVIPQGVADQLLLIVALSMLLTPLLFIAYERFVLPRYAASEEREPDVIEEKGTILIAGHGRFGGIVNRMARAAGLRTTVIDYSSQQLEMLRTFGFRVYFGDASRPDLLHAAGLAEAKVLVVAIDGKSQITEIVRHVTKTYPHVHVVARAIDRQHVYDLYAAGCRDIIRETYDSSLRAGRSVFEAMGYDRPAAERMRDAFSARDRQSLIEVADLYDPSVPAHQNEPYVAKVREMMETWEEELRGEMDIAAAGK